MARLYIPVETKQETSRVYLDEIIYIEKNRREIILITNNGSVAFYSVMAHIKQYTDERFLDCHRSYLFNMDKIRGMKDQMVHLDPDYYVFLGREAFRKGRKIFRNYINGKR